MRVFWVILSQDKCQLLLGYVEVSINGRMPNSWMVYIYIYIYKMALDLFGTYFSIYREDLPTDQPGLTTRCVMNNETFGGFVGFVNWGYLKTDGL